MLVEDPVSSGDIKNEEFLIAFPQKTGFPLRHNKYPETSIQDHVVTCNNHLLLQNSAQNLRASPTKTAKYTRFRAPVIHIQALSTIFRSRNLHKWHWHNYIPVPR